MILWPCWLGLQITLARRFHNVVLIPQQLKICPQLSLYHCRHLMNFVLLNIFFLLSYHLFHLILLNSLCWSLMVRLKRYQMHSNSPIICSPSTKTFTVWPIISKSDIQKNSAVQAILRYSSIHVTISDKQRMKYSRRVIPFASLWLVKLLTTKRKTSGKWLPLIFYHFSKH